MKHCNGSRFRALAVVSVAAAVVMFAGLATTGSSVMAQQPQAEQQAAPPTFRQLFVGTLSAVLMSATGAAAAGLTQTVAGGINAWFAAKQAKLLRGSTAARSDPALTPGAEPALGSVSGDSLSAGPDDTRFFNPATGEALEDTPQQFLQAAEQVAGAGSDIFAGVAFEVHALGAGGAATPVDPATHEFRTGDRFLLLFRPSMPGRMTVFNINPTGVETQIDSTNMAAGQLSTLGPYEFANTVGDEQLRLVLQPCSTPQLLVASRDIINVSTSAAGGDGIQGGGNPSGVGSALDPVSGTRPDASAGFAPALTLSPCDLTTTRSLSKSERNRVRTRDIVKVAAEGSTNFALDPVSQQEIESGSLVPREVTIRFVHR